MPSFQDLSFEIPISSIESIAPDFSRASSDICISLTAAPAALPSHAAHKKSLLLSFSSDRKRDNFFIFISNVSPPPPTLSPNEMETRNGIFILPQTPFNYTMLQLCKQQRSSTLDVAEELGEHNILWLWGFIDTDGAGELLCTVFYGGSRPDSPMLQI